MGDVNEACPESLDAQAREIWQQCRWIMEGRFRTAPPDTALTLQALWICRELRQESRANKIADAGKLLAEACRKCTDSVGQVPAWILELALRTALEEWDRLAK